MRLLHNLVHSHTTMRCPARLGGRIYLCANRITGQMTEAVWVPEGYRWGWSVPVTQEGMAEFLAASNREGGITEWHNAAERQRVHFER